MPLPLSPGGCGSPVKPPPLTAVTIFTGLINLASKIRRLSSGRRVLRYAGWGVLVRRNGAIGGVSHSWASGQHCRMRGCGVWHGCCMYFREKEWHLYAPARRLERDDRRHVLRLFVFRDAPSPARERLTRLVGNGAVPGGMLSATKTHIC